MQLSKCIINVTTERCSKNHRNDKILLHRIDIDTIFYHSQITHINWLYKYSNFLLKNKFTKTTFCYITIVNLLSKILSKILSVTWRNNITSFFDAKICVFNSNEGKFENRQTSKGNCPNPLYPGERDRGKGRKKRRSKPDPNLAKELVKGGRGHVPRGMPMI